jgi:hypothetical protein
MSDTKMTADELTRMCDALPAECSWGETLDPYQLRDFLAAMGYFDLREALDGLTKEFVRVFPIYYYAEPWAHDRNEALKVARAALAKADGVQS